MTFFPCIMEKHGYQGKMIMAKKFGWKQKKYYRLIGLGGVSEFESSRVRNWGRFFTYASVLVSIGLLLEWQALLLGGIDEHVRIFVNTVVWTFFTVQFFLLLMMVKDKQRYMNENWLLPVIIVVGLAFIFNIQPVQTWLRDLRPVLAITLLVPALRILWGFFIDGQLGTTLIASLIIVIVFGVVVAGVDPNVKNIWDGIWWAIATVSTVGYGDVVPTSALGRLIGAGLVVLGLGIFVIITANFLSLVLRKEAKELKKEEQDVSEILKEVGEVKRKQEDLFEMVKSIKQQLKEK